MLQFPFLPPVTEFSATWSKIELLTQVLQYLPLNQQAKLQIFHQQLLKSSLFSAKIEGNQLTLATAQQLDFTEPREKNKQEISNVMKALQKIPAYPQQFSTSVLQQIH